MARRYYPGLIHHEGVSYGISFPDLPGCISAGDTLEECLANAEEAVNLYLEEEIERGELPVASSIAEARAAADPEHIDTLMTVQLVPATLPSRSVRLTISMDEELIRQIDAAAGRYGRSGWLAGAARAMLRRPLPGESGLDEKKH